MSIVIYIGINKYIYVATKLLLKILTKRLEKGLRRLRRRVSHKYLRNKEGSRVVKMSNIIKIEK